ncbi:MAG: hypothetical protein AXW14_08585 [Alteromonas sp. Nap_26]|nr:MAG: hypothetical protein AXW14_08585 [Alteromonas sp. Nap_26]
MKSILPLVKNITPIVLLFATWSYMLDEESMRYPEDMSLHSNNPHSPDYVAEYGRCFACDAEYVPEGDRLEPDLVCPNARCEQSPHYIEDEEE